MITAVRAELRKILTVRSTYGIVIITFLFAVALASFWIFGHQNVGNANTNAGALLLAMVQVVNFASFFLAFIGILAVGHEYRYNTMLYAMTVNNRRSRIFFSKFIAVAGVTLVVGAVMVGLAIAGFYLGQSSAGIATVQQTLPGVSEVWRYAVIFFATTAIAYLIAFIVRSQIMAIAAFLVVPTLVEGLLTLLLKDNVKYLPFSAMNNLLAGSPSADYGMSALVVAAYCGGLGVIAWVLFIRRDVN